MPTSSALNTALKRKRSTEALNDDTNTPKRSKIDYGLAALGRYNEWTGNAVPKSKPKRKRCSNDDDKGASASKKSKTNHDNEFDKNTVPKSKPMCKRGSNGNKKGTSAPKKSKPNDNDLEKSKTPTLNDLLGRKRYKAKLRWKNPDGSVTPAKPHSKISASTSVARKELSAYDERFNEAVAKGLKDVSAPPPVLPVPLNLPNTQQSPSPPSPPLLHPTTALRDDHITDACPPKYNPLTKTYTPRSKSKTSSANRITNQTRRLRRRHRSTPLSSLTQEQKDAKMRMLEEAFHYLLRLHKSVKLHGSKLPRNKDKEVLVQWRAAVQARSEDPNMPTRERAWYQKEGWDATDELARNKEGRRECRRWVLAVCGESWVEISHDMNELLGKLKNGRYLMGLVSGIGRCVDRLRKKILGRRGRYEYVAEVPKDKVRL